MKYSLILAVALFAMKPLSAQPTKKFEVTSPDSKISIAVAVADNTVWTVTMDGITVITPSVLSLKLEDGTVLGRSARVASSKKRSVNTQFSAVNYKKAVVKDNYDELSIHFRGGYALEFRAYNDAVAYRFSLNRKGETVIAGEESNFNFAADHQAFIPIQWDYRGGMNFNSSFEALYREIPLSKFPEDSLAFLPVLVDLGQGRKAVILEADLEDYPGMYLNLNERDKGFEGVFAPYPLDVKPGGYNNWNLIPARRADYIAKVDGTRTLPWRVIALSREDMELLNNDIVQKLAAPSRIEETSWIKPGLVAWDWWNNWNITGVDFKAGINTDTYKHYIDFAAENNLPYIIMDAGWSNELDMFKVSPEIDLKEIVSYGRQKNVSVILWATWSAILRQADQAFAHYAALGIKGFKIDFIDRDDQVAVASTYDIARKAAAHKLLVDYHGVYKPTGLQRTYPNVVGYEGVKGLENYKWADEDQPRYAVTIPFIRMMAGPVDYTPGAMRNSNRANYRAINDHPMSKGTRAHQLAMYVVYEAPLQMLSDSPTEYRKEQESTDFIRSIPVTFDETVPLLGSVGEFLAIARRKGDTWYVAAMTNWKPRELKLDFSFLPEGKYRAVVVSDGANADRNGNDYKKEEITISSGNILNVKLAPGGGWVARIENQK